MRVEFQMFEFKLSNDQFMLLWFCVNYVLKSANLPCFAKEKLHDLVDSIFEQAHKTTYDSRASDEFPMLR